MRNSALFVFALLTSSVVFPASDGNSGSFAALHGCRSAGLWLGVVTAMDASLPRVAAAVFVLGRAAPRRASGTLGTRADTGNDTPGS